MLHTKTKTNYNANNANQSASGNKGRNSQKKGTSQYQRRNYDFLHVPSIIVALRRGLNLDQKYLAGSVPSGLPRPGAALSQNSSHGLRIVRLRRSLSSPNSASCGSYNTYNPVYDTINLKKTMALEDHAASGDLKVISVMKDPFIAQLASSKTAQIYTTDVALSQLMMAIRSQLSWYGEGGEG